MSDAKITLPPAPNWSSSQIVSSFQDLVAYGAKNQVILLRVGGTETLGSDDPVSCRSVETDKADKRPVVAIESVLREKDRVEAVSWCPSGKQLAVASLEGTVLLLQIDQQDDGAVKASLGHFHHIHLDLCNEKPKVNCLSWSRASPDVLVSAGESGDVIVWDVAQNCSRVLALNKQSIYALQTHPAQAEVVAFGCRLGLILICNIIGHGKVLYRLRAHSMDILGLSWSPEALTTFQPSESCAAQWLLAASSRDLSISIWSAEDGHKVSSLKLPTPRKRGDSQSNRAAKWITCHWLAGGVLLSSGANGELLRWSPGQQPDTPVTVHNEHLKSLFCICESGNVVYTSGQDRCIVSYRWDLQSVQWSLPTFASAIYAIVPNSVDPSILAVAAGDGKIMIWKTASQRCVYDYGIIWQRLNNAKVTCLAWHPEKEGLLAFGTSEGIIGTVDALAPKSKCSPAVYQYKHCGTVYKLCWGPLLGKKDSPASDTVLYSCGDGIVVMLPARDDVKACINVEHIIDDSNPLSGRKAPSRTDMAFQPTCYQFMALGCNDGTIELFSVPQMRLLCTLKAARKLIQHLAWHPRFVGSHTEPSEYSNWLASASNEPDVHVWDVGVLELPDESGKPVIMSEPKRVLSGHQSVVTLLDWSQHDHGRLLSVSYDCSAIIWDVTQGSSLARFAAHTGRLYSGLWSPTDADLVWSAGGDCALLGWSIAKQSAVGPMAKVKKPVDPYKKLKEGQLVSTLVAEAKASLEVKQQELMQDDRASDTRLLSASNKKVKTKLFFPLSFSIDKAASVAEDCQKIRSGKLELPGDARLALFAGDKEHLDCYIQSEAAELRNCGLVENATHLGVWCGQFGESVRLAMEQRKLSDWHISLAAAAGYALWKQACLAYSAQLIADDHLIKGVSYLLMVHKIPEAIEHLKQQKLFRAAVTVARSRLPLDSPVIGQLYREWGAQASQDGNLDLATRCFIAAEDASEAASCQAKKADTRSLALASSLAAQAGEHTKAKVLAVQAAHLCIKQDDGVCLKALSEQCSFEEVHQMFLQHKLVQDGPPEVEQTPQGQ